MSINAPFSIFLVVSHMDDDSQKKFQKSLQSYTLISLKIREMCFLYVFYSIKVLKKSGLERRQMHKLISQILAVALLTNVHLEGSNKSRQKTPYFSLSGKKSKSVFDFLTYSRETWFSFSYAKV